MRLKNISLLAGIALGAALAGCGGGSGNSSGGGGAMSDLGLFRGYPGGGIQIDEVNSVAFGVSDSGATEIPYELHSVHGVEGPVALSATITSASSAWTVSAPASVAVSAGKTAFAVRVTPPAGVAPGTSDAYAVVTVTAEGGGLRRKMSTSLGVLASGFTVALGPVTPQAGSKRVYQATVTLASVKGFAGDVAFSSTLSGSGVTRPLPATTTIAGLPTSFSLAAGAMQTFPITITVPAWAPPDIYGFAIAGTAGSRIRRVSGQFDHFSSEVSPVAVAIGAITPIAGSAREFRVPVRVAPAAGLVGKVTLQTALAGPGGVQAFPAGTTLTGLPATLDFTGSEGAQDFDLTLTLPAGYPSGTYQLTVDASFGSVTVTATAATGF